MCFIIQRFGLTFQSDTLDWLHTFLWIQGRLQVSYNGSYVKQINAQGDVVKKNQLER